MSERKDPIHAWTNPLHDSVDAMTPRQVAEIATAPGDVPSINERYEQAVLDTGVPAKFIQPLLRAIAPVRELETEHAQTEAIRELIWTLRDADGAAIRRALGFTSEESERECAALEAVPKTTLRNKVQKFLPKWTSATHRVEI